jgi:hypothetical protein
MFYIRSRSSLRDRVETCDLKSVVNIRNSDRNFIIESDVRSHDLQPFDLFGASAAHNIGMESPTVTLLLLFNSNIIRRSPIPIQNRAVHIAVRRVSRKWIERETPPSGAAAART